MKVLQTGIIVVTEDGIRLLGWMFDAEPGDPYPWEDRFKNTVALVCFQHALRKGPFEVRLRETAADESAPKADLEMDSSRIVLDVIKKAKESSNGQA